MDGRLMISVSGVRGVVGEGLDPITVARFGAAFGTFLGKGSKVVVGRDTRTSGEMVKSLAVGGLLSTGCKVIDVGICPTPTVQVAVMHHKAEGGVAITASHNPAEWNALKFMGPEGIFLDSAQGERLVSIFENPQSYRYAKWDEIRPVEGDEGAVERHIEAVLSLVNVGAIRGRKFKVAVDCCNGAGALVIPELLSRLGCEVIPLHCQPNGLFPHNPEPVAENIGELCQLVRESGADVGFAFDADVDRLAIVSERGEPLGEEHTLALVVDYVLSRRPGVVVTNVSTSMAIDDVAERYGCKVVRTPVGEVNVCKAMREHGAVIGGEGNGGIIVPDLHYGRDALIGAALVLEYMAEAGEPISALAGRIPRYFMVKGKMPLPQGVSREELLSKVRAALEGLKMDLTDGVKVICEDGWLHIRPSGTEPVVRIIAEAEGEERARELVEEGRKAVEMAMSRIGPP